MSVRTPFDSSQTRRLVPAARDANRRRQRRLFVEPLEERRLMAFNVLAEYATGANPSDLALAQLNAGSQLDLVVGNPAAGQGSVRLGNADGTFQSSQSTAAASSSVATGDLTGDGVADLVAINATSNNGAVTLHRGNGDGTFQPPQSLTLPVPVPADFTGGSSLAFTPRSAVTGDLNDDGKLDLVVGSQTSFDEYRRILQCGYYSCGYFGYFVNQTDGYVNVLLGNGSGGFAAPVVHPLGRGNSPGAIAIGDLDGDQNADVVTGKTYGLSALLGDGTGGLGAPVHSGNELPAKSISLGDIDGDGILDTVTHDTNAVYMQKGQGDGRFSGTLSAAVGHAINSVVMGDVNDDGRLDLVAVGNNFTCTSPGYYGCNGGDYSGTASVVLGNGAGQFSLPIASWLGTDFFAEFSDVALADLTGDGLPELVTLDATSGQVIVAGNDGLWVSPVALSISTPTIIEGNSDSAELVFAVTLGSPSERVVSVDYATADLTPDDEAYFGAGAKAGIDYQAGAGTLSIPAGQTTGTIRVPVIGDRIGEWDETFFVKLSNPLFANLSSSQVIGTIVDDEPYVSMEYYSDPSVTEGNAGTTPMTFTVELSAASDIPVTVNYSTADGSALAGSDYLAATGTVTFAPGQTTQTIIVQEIGDTLAEDDEYFSVNLTGPTNAKIGSSYKLAYILDNDRAPTITIDDAWAYEGNSGSKQMTFTVSLSHASNQTVRVNYRTANGNAKAGDDFVSKSGTITFNPGQTSKTITVTIKGDKKRENDEYFYVNLSRATGAEIADGEGEGAIFNDDGRAPARSWRSHAAAFDAALDELFGSHSKKRRW